MNKYFEFFKNNNKNLIRDVELDIKKFLLSKRGTFQDHKNHLVKDYQIDSKFENLLSNYSYCGLLKEHYDSELSFMFRSDQKNDYDVILNYTLTSNNYGSLKLFVNLNSVILIDKNKDLFFSFDNKYNKVCLMFQGEDRSDKDYIPVSDENCGIIFNNDGRFHAYDDSYYEPALIPEKINKIPFFTTARCLSEYHPETLLKYIYENEKLSKEDIDLTQLATDLDISDNYYSLSISNIVISNQFLIENNLINKIKNIFKIK